MAALLRWLSTVLIVAGIGLIGLAVATYGYAAVERYRAEQELAALESAQAAGEASLPAAFEVGPASAPGEPRVLPKGEAPGPSVAPSSAAEVEPAAAAPGAAQEAARAAATAAPAAVPPPAAAAPPAAPRTYVPAVRLKMARAGIDARVVEVGIVNGEFEVPKFAVGHYRDTALPGQEGNGVYAGHVSSISSGNVFANLHRAKVGDDVLLQTPRGVLRYVVSEVRVVPRTYMDVLAPTPTPTITLIACTGQWDWRLNDYLERLVVRAELTEEPPQPRLAS